MPADVSAAESYFIAISDAIDAVPPEAETLFLSKLALTLAIQLGDADRLAAAIEIVKKDCTP
jgi:hypothetical protein